MSILNRKAWREVRYPATLATSVACALELLVWLILSQWWLLALPPVTVGAVVTYRTRFRSSARVHAEKERQLQLRSGWATPLDMVRAMGYHKVRRQMKVVRPSLTALPLRERWKVPANELGVRLVRIRGWLGRRWLYVSVERMTAIIAPAGMGKTGWLLGVLLDAVGSAIVTSMKVDAIAETIELRRRVGPVYIFNPDGIGGEGYASTVRWDLLAGCEDPAVAQQRAGYLMAGAADATDIGDGEFWRSQGVRVLSIYLHAAALGGLPILKVVDWVGQATESERMQRELRDLIGRSPAKRTMLPDLDQWLSTNKNTASSTTTTITQAVQWLSTDAGRMVQPREGELVFDVDDFLADRATLYLLAEDKQYGSVAPLFTAFVGWIYDEVRARASKLPKGRLDPHLTMILDELATICPVPMDRWAPVMRGFNISAHIGLQSPSQLTDKYGSAAARVILDNVFAEMYLGGISDPKLLKDISTLFGEVTTTEWNPAHQRHEVVRRPILPPARIRDLAQFEALLVVNGLSGAATGTIQPYWERADYKELQRQRRKDARKQRKLKAIESSPELEAIEAGPADAAAGASPESRQAETVPVQRSSSSWSPMAPPEGDGGGVGADPESIERWMAEQRRIDEEKEGD